MEKEVLQQIGRPQKVCSNCHCPIDNIGRHPSVLNVKKRRQVERLDYCPECWQQLKEEAYNSFWITQRSPRRQRLKKMSKRERNSALKALFESLWDRRETEDVGPHLYFLAHLLMKWGGLRWKEDVKDPYGREVVVFEDHATGDTIEIMTFVISDERMFKIKEEVENFLQQYAPEDEELAL